MQYIIELNDKVGWSLVDGAAPTSLHSFIDIQIFIFFKHTDALMYSYMVTIAGSVVITAVQFTIISIK